MEIVKTWYFQIWVNFGGRAEKRNSDINQGPEICYK